MEEGAEVLNVIAVNVKIQPSWPADPQVWFAQVKVQFTTRGIMQQLTKYYHIVVFLAPQYATEICDLILQPPTEAPYNVLK